MYDRSPILGGQFKDGKMATISIGRIGDQCVKEGRRSQGVGSSLLNVVESEFVKKGYQASSLIVVANQIRAFNYYIKKGYFFAGQKAGKDFLLTKPFDHS